MNNNRSSSLIRWFKDRRNAIIKDSLIQHALKVIDLCQTGEDAIDSFLKNSEDSLEPIISRMISLERVADNLQDRLSLDITRGFFPSPIRQNLFRYVKHFDETANFLKNGIVDLNLFSTLQIDLPKKIFHLYTELFDVNHQSAKIVGNMVDKLGVDDNYILSWVKEVSILEKAADEAYFRIKEHALNLGKDSSFTEMYLILDVGRSWEIASDNANMAADFLKVIVKIGRKASQNS
ncbi:MAG: DUF47 family protein [Candidatus Heimdallarchaeota archaeon]|nr:MAG: DUF47 family protein [Candidatus Heimdallarchaeota archaeon]